MSFNSYEYAVFLPLIAVLYYLIPQNRIRNGVLLICSYYFYMSWNKKLIFLIIGLTLVSYVGALLIDAYDKRGKLVLVVGVGTSLGVLFVFKYFNFFLSAVLHIARLLTGGGWLRI